MSRKTKKQTTAKAVSNEETVAVEATAVETEAEKPAESPAPAVEAPKAAEEDVQTPAAEAPPEEPTAAPTEPKPDAVAPASVEVDLPPALKLIKQRLDSYVQAMQPGIPMAPGECAQNQLSLYRIIMSVVGMTGGQFQIGMSILVNTIREHRKGVFAERYVARDFENLTLPYNARLFFERMIRLLLVTADVKQRDQVQRYVDIPAVIKYLPDTKAQQRILEYYNVG